MKRLLLLAALVLLSIPVQAQVDRATLTGTVKDQMGAVIPGATVAVTHTEHERHHAGQDHRGGRLPRAEPHLRHLHGGGRSPGFRHPVARRDPRRGPAGADRLLADGGGVSEAVTVAEATRLLDTTQAAVGSVIDQNAVSQLPLAIRNWDDLMVLVPGVQGDRFTEESGGTAAGRTGGVNVHGSRSLQNNFLLDGVDNNSISTNVQELTTQVSRPSIDAIEEFKVVTSPYAAEYGRAPGAAVSVITKSGTNAFRGTGYYYFRDERFDSNTYFNEDFRTERNLTPLAKPSNDQDQFGFNLGGPILKDRLFFFADYEGTRITRGTTRSTRVPTMAERSGTFTSTDPRPAHRPAVRGQRHPRGPHRPRGRRDLRAPAGAQHERHQQLRPARRQRDRQRRPAHRQGRFPRLGQEHLLPALHLHRPRALAAGRLRRPDRRHRHVGLRRPDDHLERPRARLDAHLQPLGRERVPLLVERGRLGRGPAALRPAAAVAGAGAGRPERPVDRRRGDRRHDRRLLRRRRARAHGLARLPAEVPAHEPVGVPEHAVVAHGRPPAQARDQRARADEERVHGHPGHARLGALPRALHRQRGRRLPARLHLGRAALERVRGRPAPLGDVLLRRRRLAPQPEADAQPGAALRLHHPRARGRQQPAQLRSRGERQRRRRDGRLARGPRPGAARHQQSRAARGHRLPGRATRWC